jgi:hypothetical protein
MSIAATHGPGLRSHAAKPSKAACASSRSSLTTAPSTCPSATVMGLRRVGALVKSTPATAWDAVFMAEPYTFDWPTPSGVGTDPVGSGLPAMVARSESVKRILLSVFIGLLGLGFSATDVQAKRLGGGMSQGMKRQVPPQQQAPAAPAEPQAPTKPTAQPGAANATTTPAAVAPRRSWLGPIAGLAAGLGIAALMSPLRARRGLRRVPDPGAGGDRRHLCGPLGPASVRAGRVAAAGMRYADARGGAAPSRSEPAFSGTTAPALESPPAPALANGHPRCPRTSTAPSSNARRR